MANYKSRHTGQQVDKMVDATGIFYVAETGSVAAVTTGTTNRTLWKGTCKATDGTVLISKEEELFDGLTIVFRVPSGKLASATLGTTLQIGSSSPHPVVYGNIINLSDQFVAGSALILTYDAVGTAVINNNGTNSSIKGIWRLVTGHTGVVNSTNSTSTAAPAHGGTFTVIDSITKDANGHVTKFNTKTVTLPVDNNTDTKVTNTLGTTTKAYVTGTTTATTNTGTQVFDSGIYLGTTAGRLETGSVTIGATSVASGKAHMEYNTAEDCIDFIFD